MFDDKSVIVTGAGRGMGRSLAVAFAARGACVCLGDIDGDAARFCAQLARRDFASQFDRSAPLRSRVDIRHRETRGIEPCVR